MALGEHNTVDAIGTDKNTGHVVLTIIDEWDWGNEGQHLLALQAKLNGYLQFIETGEILTRYPAAKRPIIIDVIGRVPITANGKELLRRASEVSSALGVQLRSRYVSEKADNQ